MDQSDLDGERFMNASRYESSDVGTVLIQMVDDHDLEGIENEVADIRTGN